MLPNDLEREADESSSCDSIAVDLCHRQTNKKKGNHRSSIIHHFDLAVHMSATRVHRGETTAEDSRSSRTGIYRDRKVQDYQQESHPPATIHCATVAVLGAPTVKHTVLYSLGRTRCAQEGSPESPFNASVNTVQPGKSKMRPRGLPRISFNASVRAVCW